MVLACTGVKLQWDPSKVDTIETRFLSAVWRCPQYREYKVHVHNWANKFCLYGMYYVKLYVAAGMAGSTGHSHCTPLVPPWVPIVLPHSISISLLPIVLPHSISDTDRWSGKGRLLGLRTKEVLHCASYALLLHSCLLHN